MQTHLRHEPLRPAPTEEAAAFCAERGNGSLQSQMSSGICYYECELYNVVRQGRGVPAVPLVIVGLEA